MYFKERGKLTNSPAGNTDFPADEDLVDSEVPKTGDASLLWLAMSALSGAGLFATRKKKED